MTNRLTLSDDRMWLTIHSSDGQRKATVRSARPDGFNTTDLDYARTYQFSSMLPGQRNRAWKFVVAGHAVYVHLGTGPPTWWLPKIRIRGEFMFGWLRIMVGVAIKKEDHHN